MQLLTNPDELLLRLLPRLGPDLAVFFDFGNVLGRYSFAALRKLLAEKTGITEAEVRGRMVEYTHWYGYHLGKVSTEEFYSRALLRLELDMPLDEFIQLNVDVYSPPDRTIGVVHAVKPHCHSVNMLSNNNEAHASHVRRTYPQLFVPFDQVLMSHEIGHFKPEHSCFKYCQELMPGANRFLLVDDMLTNVRGAQECGWEVCWYNCDPQADVW